MNRSIGRIVMKVGREVPELFLLMGFNGVS
jgi:hypothetical protein